MARRDPSRPDKAGRARIWRTDSLGPRNWRSGDQTSPASVGGGGSQHASAISNCNSHPASVQRGARVRSPSGMNPSSRLGEHRWKIFVTRPRDSWSRSKEHTWAMPEIAYAEFLRRSHGWRTKGRSTSRTPASGGNIRCDTNGHVATPRGCSKLDCCMFPDNARTSA